MTNGANGDLRVVRLHTDAAPFADGTVGYGNWVLSADRANASRRELSAGRAPCDKLARLSGVPSMPLKRALGLSRYVVLIAVAGALIGSTALLVYEAIVIADASVQTIRSHGLSPKIAKVLAVGLIEAIDIFLIAIVGQIIGLGLYVLFVDDRLPLPSWLRIRDLDDLKSHLVSSVIAVLAVLFAREAVAWDGQRDLLGFGVALALVIAALTLYLAVKGKR